MTVQLDTFVEFKEDHRKVRDTLFTLRAAFQQRDPSSARTILGELDALTGPHFRFEEESLYPALRPIFSDYVDKMLEDHDGAIRTARGLAEIVQRDSFSDADVEAGLRGVLAILPHVSDCDGLSIFMETFEPSVFDRISESIRASREAALPLLTWAATVRERQV
jgi:hypothetical protein